jgi:hypothetical protein
MNNHGRMLSQVLAQLSLRARDAPIIIVTKLQPVKTANRILMVRRQYSIPLFAALSTPHSFAERPE